MAHERVHGDPARRGPGLPQREDWMIGAYSPGKFGSIERVEFFDGIQEFCPRRDASCYWLTPARTHQKSCLA